MPRIPMARLVAPLCVLALISTACGSAQPSDASLDEVEELAEVAEVFTEPVDQDPIPTPKRPELLGLDGPSVDETTGETERGLTPPLILAFEDVEGAASEDADPTIDPGLDDAASAAPEQQPAGAADLEQVTPTTGDAGVEEDPDEAALPPPGPPPAPLTAGYEDPSSMLLAASGRSIGLFADDEISLTTRGVTADTISVGGLASQTLAGGGFRVDSCVGARARFEQANHHRELTREILFDGCYDDTGQPTIAEGLAGTLVRDEVFAVAPLASPAFGAESVFRDARVPYVGYDALPAFCGRGNAVGFGSHGAQRCPVLDARGFVSLSLPALTAYEASLNDGDVPSIAYAVEAGPHGEAVAASRTFEAELLGLESPEFVPVLPTSAEGPRRDWSDVTRGLMGLEAEAIFFEGGATAGLAEALREAGYEGDIVSVGHLDPLDIVDHAHRAALAGLTVLSPGLDLANRDGAGWAAIESAAAAVGYASEAVGLDFIEGYVAADLLVRALDATPEPLSVEQLSNTVNSGWWYPGVDGVACGSWWPASHLISVPCVSIARVDAFSAQLVPVLGLVETEPQVRFELGD